MAFERARWTTRIGWAGCLVVACIVILATLGAARPSLAASSQSATVTARVGSEGGTLQVPKAGFSLTFPRGALTRPTVVRLRVTHEQFGELSRPGYVLSPHGIELALDLTAVAADAVLILRLDFPGDYDPVATTMGIANIRGFTVAVPSRRTRRTQLIGSVDQPSLRALSRHAGHRGHMRLRIFTANAELEAAPILSTSLSQFVYDPSTGIGSFYHPLTDLTNKRVALCVHGIIATLDDLVSLAAYLATYTRPGDSQPYYDAVIGFEYTSNAPLAQIGGAMAELVGKSVGGVAALDVYAHSMGTVVSRYAIEIGGTAPRLGPLPGGGHYVSLGGPQVGVPFGNISALQTLLLLFGFSAKPCILDLLTDGRGGLPETAFLSTLNPGTDGPDRATAAYYSLSADNYAAESPPLGDIVNHLYTRSVPPDGVTNDGLVGVYSAQSPVLGLQSASWQPGLTFEISHHALVISAAVFEELGKLIASW